MHVPLGSRGHRVGLRCMPNYEMGVGTFGSAESISVRPSAVKPGP